MLSINIPSNVEIEVANGFLKISGSEGTFIKKVGTEVKLARHNSRLYVLNGGADTAFYLSLIRGYLNGVSKGYRCKLRLVGVGYRAMIKSGYLFLKIGFSHEVAYKIPADVNLRCSKAKGTFIVVQGKEAQRVNQVASEIRALRKPDVYKGKGIHYEGEIVRLKKGKREST